MPKGYEPKLPAKQLAILVHPVSLEAQCGLTWATDNYHGVIEGDGLHWQDVKRIEANHTSAVARFAEPLALTSVFPYLPEMIESFGVPKDNVARWAGLTGAVFSLSQSFTAVPWGKASDTIGRKPTICLGLISTMICFIIWGMSTSLPMAITVRAIMGGGNGNVGIIRTMVAEMVPEKELQPTAFSIMPLVWSIGSVFGPSFGGFFARPAEQYPSVFGNSWLFKTYPFLLPNLMACIFFFISVVTAVLFLKETLETKRHDRDWGLIIGEKLIHPFRKTRSKHLQKRSFVDDEATAPLLAHSGLSKAHKIAPQPALRDIFTRQVRVCIFAYTLLALHSVSYDQILAVFLSYPLQTPDSQNTHLPFHFSGGFGLSSGRIGTIFTIYGFACGIIQFLLFPPLCSKFGALNCFRVSTILYPLVYMATPYSALIQGERDRYIALGVILLVKSFAVIIGFPCITILLTNAAPSLRILGTLNGFATTFSGLGRAFGPAVTGSTFTYGVQRGYVTPAWALLAVVGFLQAIPAWMIVEGSGFAHAPDSDDEDDDDVDDLLPSSDEANFSDSTAVDDDADEQHDTFAAIAIDAPDLAAAIIPEPDEVDSDVPPLEPTKTLHSSVSVAAAPGHVRLRRMSASGQDLERDPADPKWRLKQGDDDIEG